jgi:hypothetical protein
MLVGGLYEAVLDYRIVSHFQNVVYSTRKRGDLLRLRDVQKAELLLAVLSGNLDRNTENLEEIIKRVVGLDPGGGSGSVKPVSGRRLSSALIRMLNMLSSQYNFGPIVGAFIYQVTSLTTNLGDYRISLALAFRLWRMVIVHVLYRVVSWHLTILA